MPSTAERTSSVDRRLLRRVSIARRYLVIALVAAAVATVAVVVQAVLLSTVIAGAVLHHWSLDRVRNDLIGVALAFVARSAALWAAETGTAHTSAQVNRRLRRDILEHSLGLGPAWLSTERTGELSLTATRGVDALDTYFGRYLPQALVAALVPLALLAWVAAEDWISAIILAGLVLLIPPTMIAFGRRSQRTSERQWRRLSSLASRFLELLQGLATLRAFGQSRRGHDEVAAASEGLRQTTMVTLRVAFLSSLSLDLLAGLGTGLTAMVLGLRLLGGAVPLATALAILLVAPEIFIPLRRVGTEFHASQEGRVAAARILEVLDTPVRPDGAADASRPDRVSTPLVAPDDEGAVAPGSDDEGAVAPGADDEGAEGEIRFTGVGFVHRNRERPTLERADLALAPGEHVALAGPSGSGKSTLLALALGFLRPSIGSVEVAGLDPWTEPDASRRSVAWVPQQAHLFRGSLADNLRLGDPTAPSALLTEVVDLVGLTPLVGSLPRGLSTEVGEGGLQLSPGETQRVALARAVLRDAPLVLLDEPTAHLDDEHVAHLRHRLAPWFEDRTVLLVSHGSHLLARVDRWARLEGGRIVELDTPPLDLDLAAR